MLFIGMPALVAIAGSATLLMVWREDQALRDDATIALAILRRRLALVLPTTATLLAGAILVFAVAHVVTD